MIDNQKPTFSAGMLPVNGDGEFAIEMANAYGYKPDPWQELLIKQMYTEECVQIGISVPRQNGKNGAVEVLELFSPMMLGKVIVHTAHRRDTVMKHFARLCKRWYENPKYKDIMNSTEVTHGSGFQEINFDNGGRISFMTRSATGGRGDSADIIILDEAQEMTKDEWAALVPILTASPDAMIIMFGSPPLESREGQGVVFQKLRQDACDGKLNKGDVYIEWGVDDLKEDLRDEEIWKRVNPAWDYRINKNIVRVNSRSMDDEEFAREHLGYWYKGTKNTIYKEEHWTAGLIDKRPSNEDVERFAVGVVYSQDGESWTAAFGAVLKDGNYYSELIDLSSTKKGMAQIIQIIAHFHKDNTGFVGAISYGKAGTLNLIGEAEQCDLFPASLIEICRYDSKVASNALLDNVMDDGTLKHVDQDPLKESLLSIDKYMMNGKGGGFGFISRSRKLIASEAVALALYWAKNRKPKKKRPKQSIW